MNLSLRKRLTIFFVATGVFVVLVGLLVVTSLDSFKREINMSAGDFAKKSMIMKQAQIDARALFEYGKQITKKRRDPQQVSKITSACDSLDTEMKKLEGLYEGNSGDAKKINDLVAKILGNVDSIRINLEKGVFYDRNPRADRVVHDHIDKINNDIVDLHDIVISNRADDITNITKKTEHHMFYILLIVFLFMILFSMILPKKIALPFRKIRDALRELQNCNFDVQVHYEQDDELGEIGREMNKMIVELKAFEELRAERVSVEKRKFDALANMVKRPVLVARDEGELIYMNNQGYSLLQVQSEDVIGKTMSEARIPASIVESFNLAIKRRAKIENAAVSISAKHNGDERKKEGEEKCFEGYANVIPIRGKESSSDCYLMVLSTEVFT